MRIYLSGSVTEAGAFQIYNSVETRLRCEGNCDIVNMEAILQGLQLSAEERDFVCAALRNDNDAVSFFMSLASSTRDELKELFSLSLEIMGDLIAVKKDRYAKTYFFPTPEDAISAAASFGLAKILDAYYAVCSAIDDLGANASQAVTLMSILLNSAKKGK